MIRRLRARHRWMLPAIAAVTAAIAILGLSARRPVPVQDTLPPGILVARGTFERAATELAVERAPDGRWIVEVAPGGTSPAPSTGLYWSAGSGDLEGRLPADAYLVGVLSDAGSPRYRLPARARPLAGTFLLYSLDLQRVVDVAVVERVARDDPGGAG